MRIFQDAFKTCKRSLINAFSFSMTLPLRYYAAFEVEHLSSFSTKLIYLCKKLPLAYEIRQSKHSLQIYNINIFSIS